MALEQLFNGAGQSTLSSSIDGSQTTLVVASASGFPTAGNFRIRIDDELFKVTGVSGTTFTVVRGDGSTTGTSHTSGVNVDLEITSETLAALRSEMYQVGTYANRPSSARAGAFYGVTDGGVFCRYDGSAWEEWGPLFKIVPPSLTWDAQWSWINQGDGTLTRDGASWIFKIPANASSPVRQIVKTKPSVPYTIEIGARFLMWPLDYVGWGLLFKNSSNAIALYNAVFHSVSGNAVKLGVDKFDNSGAFDSTYVTLAAAARLSTLNFPVYFRITEDATYRTCQFSQDGVFWYTTHVVVIADFLGSVDRIGLGGFVSNSKDTFMEIFHYKEY